MIRHLLLLLALFFVTSPAEHPLSRNVDLVNESGDRFEVFWIHPETHEMVKYNDVLSGAALSLNSYVNHTFMLREASMNETCLGSYEGDHEGCHVGYIVISESDSQVVHVKKGLEVEYEDRTLLAQSQAEHVLDRCQQLALEAVNTGAFSVDDMVECMQGDIATLLERKNEELSFESKLRVEIADQLENYTCADATLPTTPPLEVREWTHDKDGSTRTVHVLHEHKASQIHVLKNFITDDECEAIEEAARPSLHRGTVADGSGGSRLSDHRKAWQAGVSIPWAKEEQGNRIARVVRRLYDYANHATGYNMSVVGQEDLMSIQYFTNKEDESPDQYRPHCDGDCDGMPHKMGGRVATMVMYCEVPDAGGSTNFQHANVHVKPEKHAAAFFSYMDSDTMIKDTGFTTHSGCPVTAGTKRIAVQWMRVGVDKENPWDSFNTLTIKKSEAEDC